MRGKRAKEIRRQVPHTSTDEKAKTFIQKITQEFKTLLFFHRRASSWKQRYRQAKRDYYKNQRTA